MSTCYSTLLLVFVLDAKQILGERNDTVSAEYGIIILLPLLLCSSLVAWYWVCGKYVSLDIKYIWI